MNRKVTYRPRYRRLEMKNAASINQAYPAMVTNNYNYDAWGLNIETLFKPTHSSTFGSFNGPNPQRHRYNGKEQISSIRLYDHGARQYDPVIGRWFRVDPLAYDPKQIELSPHNSFWNNPIKNNDPNGRCPNCITGLIGAGLEPLFGGGFEIGKQLYNNANDENWAGVGGSALQGGITEWAAGLIGGASFFTTAAVAGGARSVGGTVNRTIQGKETAVQNLLTDMKVGAVFGTGGKLIGNSLQQLTSSVNKRATSKLTKIASNVLKIDSIYS